MKYLTNKRMNRRQRVTQNEADTVNSNISKDILINIEKIKNELGNPSDLIINITKMDNYQFASLYIDNIIDKNIINSLSMEISEMLEGKDNKEESTPEGRFDLICSYLTGFRKAEEGSDLNTLCTDLLNGKTILLLEGGDRFLSIKSFSVEGRAVEEPTTQSIVRGPKEGFIEKADINIALVRKRIKNKALRVENLLSGSVTNTKIALMYIDGIARKDIVDEVRNRIKKIKIDGILDSGYIEELIKDDRYSIFPEFLNSERPDAITAELLEGKVAIFVDGTSYVLTAPALFAEFLQASEDYYHHFIVSTMIRLIRYLALVLTTFVPAAYVALITFHQEMIPTPLLISVAAQREGVPFPAFVEAMMMEGVFEILREAGVRMPRVVGPAISIVGALVLGQAAVEAGIVSAAMVIIVSITAISSFAIPNYSMSNAARMIRFGFLLLAGIFGLYGVFMGFIALILHLCKLKSIGVPYMTPIAPKIKYALKDTIIRYPLWKNKTRPAGISSSDIPRASGDNPVDPKQKEKPEFR